MQPGHWDFEIDVEGGRLLRRGQEVRLERKAFALLCYLGAHPDRLVSKEELLREVWQGRVLSDGALANTVAKLRRALGQKSTDSSPIETVHGRGYRFRVHAAGRTSGADQASTSLDPFVGREAVMRALVAGLDRARAGSGGLVLLGGDAGFGKTRTAGELAARARERATRVWFGAAYEGEGAPAYWPWIQILRSALSEGGARDYVPRSAWALAQLAPELTLTTRAPAGLEPQAMRFHLFDELTRFLYAASAATPCLLIIDDLHWADRESIDLLGFVARSLANRPVLLLGTLREHEPIEPERRSALAHLSRAASRHNLRGLSLPEVDSLVRALAVELPHEKVAPALHARTDGNPFFVRQLIDLLVQAGDGGAADVASIELPPAVRDVIRRRLAALSARTLRTLGAAAVLGQDFGAMLLAEVAAEEPANVLDDLDAVLRIGVLERVPSADTLRFCHATLRDTLYEDLALGERGELHRRAARVLSARHATSARSWGEVARHELHALPADVAGIVEHCGKAAAAALDAGGLDAAAALLTRAIAKLELEGADGATRAELLLQLGTMQLYAGLSEAAWRAFRTAASIAQQADDPALLARVVPRLADCARVGTGDPALARALAEQALDRTPEHDSAGRASLLAHRGSFGQDLAADERAAIFDRAEALARASGVEAVVLEVAHARATLRDPHALAANAGAADRFLHLIDRSPRHAAELRHASLRRFSAYETQYLCALMQADLDAADQALARCRETSATSHVKSAAILVELMQIGRAFGDDRVDDAALLFSRLTTMARESEPTVLAGVAHTLLATLAHVRGVAPSLTQSDFAELDAVIDPTSHRSAQVLIGRANAYARGGRLERAREMLARVRPLALQRMPVHYGDLGMLCMLADTYRTLADTAGAERVYAMLEPFAELNAVLPNFQYVGAVAQRLGMLAKLIGRHTDGRAHFETALRINRRLRMPRAIAKCERELQS